MGTIREYGGGQRGIALVLVLWVVALMTVMALSMTAMVRTDGQLTHNRLEEARLRALSDAAVTLVALRFGSGLDEDIWWPDGGAHIWTFAGRELEVRVYNESSRINLNGASRDLLERLLEAVGVEATERQALVAAIEDWRDADESTRMLGAESAEYRAAGRSYGSRNGRFSSVVELMQVMGMTAPLYRKLAPHLTVEGLGRRVNVEYASNLVRAVVEGDVVPPSDPSVPREPPEELDTMEEGHHGTGGPIYRIHVSALDGGPTVETLVRRAGRKGAFLMLSRRMLWGAREGEEAVAADGTEGSRG